MKKFILFGTCLFIMSVFISLVNGPLSSHDKVIDQEIENLITSADVKILKINDRVKNKSIPSKYGLVRPINLTE